MLIAGSRVQEDMGLGSSVERPFRPGSSNFAHPDVSNRTLSQRKIGEQAFQSYDVPDAAQRQAIF